MNDVLNDLKNDYKQNKKEATTKEEKKQIKQDYKEMKELIKGADELLQKNDEDLETMNKEWNKLASELNQNFNSIENEKVEFEEDENLKRMTKEIEDTEKRYEEQKKHSEEVISQVDETMKKIDEKITELEKRNNNMNNENVIEEINEKNEMFIRELMSKDSFMINWLEGAVLPKNHPNYYNGRIDVDIKNLCGNINFEKNEYQITEELVHKLYNYIEANINELIKISLNQNAEMYAGVVETLSIKYKSIFINISELNASSEEEKELIRNVKNNIKTIILENSKLKENNDINNESIEMAIKEIAGSNDIDKNNILSKLIKRIIEMPADTDTSIAELMNLDNNSVAMVEPLIQGEIFNSLMKVCEKLNIKIEVNHDEIGGLGYHYKFKKIDSVNKKEYTQEELKELFYRTMNETEVSKLNELGMNEEIAKLNTPTHQVKYFDNVGYVLIGDGYIIQVNGMEQQRYFATIVSSPEEAKQEILKKLNS